MYIKIFGHQSITTIDIIGIAIVNVVPVAAQYQITIGIANIGIAFIKPRI